jgi:hypothetical protein
MAHSLPRREFTRRVHPEDLWAVEAASRRAILGKTQASVEFRIIRPDGSVRYVSTDEGAVLDEQGNVKGMRVVSGHPLLIPAALSAVSKRKYEPTILDGEPTAIALEVQITFSMS